MEMEIGNCKSSYAISVSAAMNGLDSDGEWRWKIELEQNRLHDETLGNKNTSAIFS
jgi:hypothetical protein